MATDIKTLVFDEDVCELYFAMLLKSPAYLKIALAHVEDKAFKELLPNPDYSLFWYCLRTALQAYPDLKITKPVMFKGCFKLLAPIFQDEESRREKALNLALMYERLEKLDVVPNTGWLLDHTKYIMQQGQVVVQAREIMSQVEAKSLDMAEAVQKISALSSQTAPADREAVDPFKLLMGANYETPALEKTYVEWFDAAVGGGLVVNEPHTVIMPTGQGKTTLAAMISGYRALHGKSTMVVVTESGVHAQTVAKPLAALFNKPTSSILDKVNGPLAKPTEEETLKVRMANNCIRYVDLVAKAGEGATFETFEAAFEREKAAGFVPGLVIIDWAGTLAMSMMMSNKKLSDMHTALEHLAVACTRFCRANQIPILITHQVAAAEADKNGIKPVYTVQDADNCKKWANHFCNAVVSTKFAEDTGYGTFFFEKVRYGTPCAKVVVQRNGANCLFIKAGADIEFSKNRYVSVTKRGAFGKKLHASAEDET